ncbi:hypothetical protein Y032_0009g555 [Ancylostoma ceylanicum]|nr:hypothetical protein Y032_0009g555 [Ancylostoma ceylanicum]
MPLNLQNLVDGAHFMPDTVHYSVHTYDRDGTPKRTFAPASRFRAGTSPQPKVENALARILLNISVVSQNCVLRSCQRLSS